MPLNNSKPKSNPQQAKERLLNLQHKLELLKAQQQQTKSTRRLLIATRFIFILILLCLLLFMFLLYNPIPQHEETNKPTIIQKAQPESEQEILTQVEETVLSIFKKNNKLLKGIKHIRIALEDLPYEQSPLPGCSGKILGAYSNDTIIIRHTDQPTNNFTLYHEIGHNVWNKISSHQREIWTNHFHNTKTFVTTYAQKNPEENFAENFACFHTNFRNCKKIMTDQKIEFIQHIS